MQAAMRLLLAGAAFATALPVVQGADQGVSPIGKVLEMITDLQAKVLKEGGDAQKLYDEFAEWCEDRSKDLGFEIKTGKSEVESLKAVIAEEVALAASLQTKIEELSGAISSNEAELKKATSLREKEHTVFAAEEKELMEVLDMLERASGIIEREMNKGGAALVQIQSASSVAQALETMVQAAMIGSADAKKLTALIQASNQADDSDAGAPAAAAYEGQSSGVLDTLSDLAEKAQAQLDEARNKETAALHNYQMLKQSLEDEIKFAKKDMDEAKKDLAASTEKKSTAEGDLTVTSKDLAADIEAKSELHHECMTKAEDFETEVKSRGEELKALATAKKIIQEMTGDAAEASYSFVQTSSKAGARVQAANFQVVKLVRDLAAKHHNTALAQLATRMSSAMHAASRNGADPFEKVRGLITDMISKLEAEAEADATKKAYCDKEMSETETKKDDKTDELEKLNTKIEQMTAESAKLKEEVAALQQALSKLSTAQAEMDKLRQEEHAVYVKSKAEMEQGLEGVKKALQVLRDYYSKDAAHDSGDGAGSGIIGMLEVAESDFSKNLAEIVSVEETALAEYETETKENEIERTTKEQDVKYKTKESASLDKSTAEAKSDAAGVKEELDAVLEYYAKVQEECVAKPESYEERKKRREAEVAGLKEALTILEEETSLVQRSSTHKALRGVRKHLR